MASLGRTGQGVLLALLAYAVYATSDALVKGIGRSLGPFEIGFITTLFSLVPGLVAKPKGERLRDTFQFRHPGHVHFIAITRALSNVLAVYAFISIPLADVYCIIFMMPLFITLLSVVFLKEEVPPSRWVLIAISFVGVVIVVRPGFRELQLGHLVAVTFALFAAIALVGTRMVSDRERRLSLFVMPLLYTLAINAGVLLAVGFALPDLPLLIALVLCGLLGGAGYLMQVTALSMAPASRVAPMQYSQILWALIFGAVFFNEVPDWIGLVGLTIVVASGIANVLNDGRRARVAGRWAEYRGRQPSDGPTGDRGPGPDAI